MADTGSAAPIMAEGEKTTTEATQQPALKNEEDGQIGNGAENGSKVEESVKIETTDSTTEPSNPDAKSEQPKHESTARSTDSPERKRKFNDRDDRDWRDRRDDDNRRDGNSRRHNARGDRGGNKGNRYHERNVRTNFEQLPESDDPEEIRKQVEFYFSDSNLLTDRFLITQVGGSTNKAVPVKTIHSFRRMRHFQPYSAVVAALRDSEVLNISGTEGNEEIQRKVPLPQGATAEVDDNVQIYEDNTRSRSIYAKGFGEENATTQFDIEAFFAPYGPTNAIRLRRTFVDKSFKGSVFVEFDSDETAKQFLELESKPKWQGKDLKIMSKEEYVTIKAADVKAGIIPSNDRDGNRSGRGRGGQRGSRGGRGGRGGRGRGDRGDRRGYMDRDRPRGRPASHSRSRSRSRSPYRAAKKETEVRTDATATRTEDTETVSKKRSREDGDDQTAATADVKKAKVEEVEG